MAVQPGEAAPACWDGPLSPAQRWRKTAAGRHVLFRIHCALVVPCPVLKASLTYACRRADDLPHCCPLLGQGGHRRSRSKPKDGLPPPECHVASTCWVCVPFVIFRCGSRPRLMLPARVYVQHVDLTISSSRPCNFECPARLKASTCVSYDETSTMPSRYPLTTRPKGFSPLRDPPNPVGAPPLAHLQIIVRRYQRPDVQPKFKAQNASTAAGSGEPQTPAVTKPAARRT